MVSVGFQRMAKAEGNGKPTKSLHMVVGTRSSARMVGGWTRFSYVYILPLGGEDKTVVAVVAVAAFSKM